MQAGALSVTGWTRAAYSSQPLRPSLASHRVVRRRTRRKEVGSEGRKWCIVGLLNPRECQLRPVQALASPSCRRRSRNVFRRTRRLSACPPASERRAQAIRALRASALVRAWLVEEKFRGVAMTGLSAAMHSGQPFCCRVASGGQFCGAVPSYCGLGLDIEPAAGTDVQCVLLSPYVPLRSALPIPPFFLCGLVSVPSGWPDSPVQASPCGGWRCGQDHFRQAPLDG